VIERPENRRGGTSARSSYAEQVFINCPFDGEYRPMFEALVFAVHDCGFVARCALELDDGSEVRIHKVQKLIEICRLGIHDISRTELDSTSQLPRFNMPLELGLFLGAKRYGSGEQQTKLCLILDREPHRFQKFCSDISGQDIRSHAGDPAAAVKIVRNWLRNVSARSEVVIPSGKMMVERYELFRRELPPMCERFRLDPEELIFNDFTTLTAEWLKLNPW
jgi:hypothetical protein